MASSSLGVSICFVDMPFGQKPDLKSGVFVDFDQIYNGEIKPAIEEWHWKRCVGMKSAPAGSFTARCSRLLLSEFAVADLTLANANVFYELGIRHVAKPFTTVPILANVSALPFDVALVRAVGYQLENGKRTERPRNNPGLNSQNVCVRQSMQSRQMTARSFNSFQNFRGSICPMR